MDAFDKVKNYDIEEVSIKLLLPFKFSDTLTDVSDRIEQLTLAKLAQSRRPLLTIDSSSFVGNSGLWEKAQFDDSSLSSDLYPHVARILTTKDMDVELSKSYQLSMGAADILNQYHNSDETSFGLALRLSDDALKRFDDSAESISVIPWRLGNQSIRLNLYNLGIGVFEVDAVPCRNFIKRHGFNGLQEFVNGITRVKHKSSDSRLGAMIYRSQVEGKPDNSFELFNLIGACVGLSSEGSVSSDFESYMGAFEPLSLIRYFSYTALRLHNSIELPDNQRISEADAIGLVKCLAHRQTKDHRATRLVDNSENAFTPFQNITYYTCIEGGAVVLTSDSAEEDVTFVSSFISSKLKTAYWPMTLIAYIEFIYLFKLNGDINPSIRFDEGNKDTIEILKTYRQQILQFRLQYRFAQASHLQLHNTYYNNWRLTFESEKLMDELVEDLTQVNSYLSSAMEAIEVDTEKRHNKNIGTLGIFATGMLSLLSLWGTNFRFFDGIGLIDTITISTLLLGLIVTMMAIFLYRDLDKFCYWSKKLLFWHNRQT